MCLWHLESHSSLLFALSHLYQWHISNNIKHQMTLSYTRASETPKIPSNFRVTSRTLGRWGRECQIEFHPSIYNTIHITQATSLILRATPYTTAHLKQLTLPNTLGSHSLPTFVWTATSECYCLKRNLRISSTQVKTPTYQNYVQPRFEYAAWAWDPVTKSNKTSKNGPDLQYLVSTTIGLLVKCHRYD